MGSAKTLDLRRPPKRASIRRALVELIKAQGLEPGERIPPQTELATAFSVTEVTIHRTLTDMVKEGTLHRVARQGTFVGPDPKTVRTRSVCLVLPGEHLDDQAYNPIYWPYVQDLTRSFMRAVSSAAEGWRFMMHPVPADADVQQTAAELADHDLVFFHWGREPRPLLEYLAQQRIMPVAVFSQPDAAWPCLTVDHDAAAGARKAVMHLLDLGYRRIALITSEYDWGEYWVQGYRDALADFGIEPDPKLILRVGEERTDGLGAAARLVQRGMPCDAIFADTDMRALAVVEGLRQEGLRVPEDVGVMGHDGLDLAVHHPPYLTSLDIPRRRMIEYALKEAERADGKAFDPRHVNFEGEIIQGRTTMSRSAGTGDGRAA